MAVDAIWDQPTPACTDRCLPRRHDAQAHERHGYLLGLLAATYTPPTTVVRTGALAVRLTDGAVWVHGAEVHLSGRERALLRYLARHVGQWQANDEIVAAVWGPEWVTLRLAADGSRECVHLLSVSWSRLRQRLGGAGALLETADGAQGRRRLAWVEVTP